MYTIALRFTPNEIHANLAGLFGKHNESAKFSFFSHREFDTSISMGTGTSDNAHQYWNSKNDRYCVCSERSVLRFDKWDKYLYTESTLVDPWLKLIVCQPDLTSAVEMAYLDYLAFFFAYIFVAHTSYFKKYSNFKMLYNMLNFIKISFDC